MDSNRKLWLSIWYWGGWVLVVAILIAFQEARTDEWTVIASPGHLVKILGGGLVGGGFFGMLYRAFDSSRRSKESRP